MKSITGRVLRALAEDEGMTFVELAKRAKVSRQAIYAWINTGDARLSLVRKIAAELRMSEAELLAEIGYYESGDSRYV